MSCNPVPVDAIQYTFIILQPVVAHVQILRLSLLVGFHGCSQLIRLFSVPRAWKVKEANTWSSNATHSQLNHHVKMQVQHHCTASLTATFSKS